MLRELLTVFRGDNRPLASMAENFRQMLALSLENTHFAGKLLFDQEQQAEDRSEIYKKDIQINKLERKIRKQVMAHLSFKENIVNVPYCLVIFSLAKDAERLGDYAKNLSEIVEFNPDGLPMDDDRIQELNEIRKETERAFSAAAEVLESRNRELAKEYILAGKNTARRCEVLLARLARSDFQASTTTAAVLATRYYKRVGGHVINILTSVVMPLH